MSDRYRVSGPQAVGRSVSNRLKANRMLPVRKEDQRLSAVRRYRSHACHFFRERAALYQKNADAAAAAPFHRKGLDGSPADVPTNFFGISIAVSAADCERSQNIFMLNVRGLSKWD